MVWVSDVPPDENACTQPPSAPSCRQASTSTPVPQSASPGTLVLVSMHSWLVPDPMRHEKELPSSPPHPHAASASKPRAPTTTFIRRLCQKSSQGGAMVGGRP